MALGLKAVIYGAYLVFVFGIAIYSYGRIDDAQDLLVAGFELPLPFVTGSLIASLLTATYFFTAVGLGFNVGGWEATAVLTGLGSTMILGGIIWTKPLRRLRGWTMSDYFYRRFGENKVIGAYAGLVMWMAFNIFLVGALTAGGAYIVAAVLNISFTTAVFITAFLTAVYSMLGGLWAVAYTDTLQAVVGLAGLFFGAFLLFGDAGWGTLGGASHWNVPHLLTAGGTTFWSLYLVFAVGDLPAADIGQRVAGSDSPDTARKAMLIAGTIIVIVGFLPGLIGEALQPLYSNPENAERLFIQYIDTAMNPIIGGIVLSAIGAAAMSTLDSAYVAGTACLLKNVYLDVVDPDVSDARLMFLSRAFIGLSALIGALLAAYFQQALFLAVLTFDIIFVTLVPALILGVYWKQVNSKATIASITVGLVSYILLYQFGNPLTFTADATVLSLVASMWSTVNWVPALLLSTIAIVVGSYVWEPTQDSKDAYERQHDDRYDDTDVPEMFGDEAVADGGLTQFNED
jgi:SSS family solute:Na+ symporter